MDEQKRKYTFGKDEFSLEDAYHDCKLVFDGITDDDSFQEADTGLIFYYANEIIYALHEALEGKDTNVLSNDCISRQAAIDEVINLWADKPFGNPTLVEIKDCIEKLPPAQPGCEDAVSRADVDILIEEAQTAWLRGDIMLMYPALKKGLQKVLPVTPKQPGWIPCSKKLPEMHDAGILKKVGIKQRSKMVYITIEGKRNDGSVERITDTDAELRDGEWHSNTLRWLKAAGKKIEVTAWMPHPEPYNPEGDEKA